MYKKFQFLNNKEALYFWNKTIINNQNQYQKISI